MKTHELIGKGHMGSALAGPLRILCFVDRVVFWILPLTYFDLPKNARAYLFPQSVKINYFCRGPISVDPFVRNQIRGCQPFIYSCINTFQ